MAKKKTPERSASPAAPRRRTPKKTEAVPVAAHGGPSHDEIAQAAYRRYLNRGASDGRDFDDWLEAERELRSRG